MTRGLLAPAVSRSLALARPAGSRSTEPRVEPLASSEARPDSRLPQPETQGTRDRGSLHCGPTGCARLPTRPDLGAPLACSTDRVIAPARVILKVWCKRSRCIPMLHVHFPTLGFAASLSDATNSSVTMS